MQLHMCTTTLRFFKSKRFGFTIKEIYILNKFYCYLSVDLTKIVKWLSKEVTVFQERFSNNYVRQCTIFLAVIFQNHRNIRDTFFDLGEGVDSNLVTPNSFTAVKSFDKCILLAAPQSICLQPLNTAGIVSISVYRK